ncbi:NUDIX domain-containing protein [Haloechinothrix sp. LS1_15]|uniref:NUDIX domain-containing protein n=1 Tax=Haloechinothrix sp. LS1_15 TaxID=2652248 RepID=UPI002947087F|nr:NUDIX domain-containing protein [Haloechinothrix sp. LS1_15]MDV6013447.1 NUDIX hydrolase [Haloechinothrix sp. LS1_15]
MFFGDGDGFVSCSCGRRHWGKHGAAGLLLTDPDRGVLLQRRAWWLQHGRTWAVPGGAMRGDETAERAALREAAEEAGIPADAVRVTAASIDDHGSWRYTTVLAAVRAPVRQRARSPESSKLAWVPAREVVRYRLQRDFAAAWPALRAQLGRELVLLVDGRAVPGQVPARRTGQQGRPQPACASEVAEFLPWLRDDLALLRQYGIAARAVGLDQGTGWWWWPRVVLVVPPGAEPHGTRDGVTVVTGGKGEGELLSRLDAAGPGDHRVVVTGDDREGALARERGAGVLTPAELDQLLSDLPPDTAHRAASPRDTL